MARKPATGEGSIYYSDSDGLWKAWITLPNGEQRGKSARSQREALDWLTEQRSMAMQRMYGADGQIRLGEFLDRHLEDVAQYALSPRIHDRLSELIGNHIKPELGNAKLKADELRRLQVRGFYPQEEEETLTEWTLRYIRAAPRKIFDLVSEWGLVKGDLGQNESTRQTHSLVVTDAPNKKIINFQDSTEANDQHELVTACLLSWKRPNNLQPIVDLLHQYDYIDEILVWNNNQAVDLNLKGDRVRVIVSPENFLCYGRYLCARLARNEVIYLQDDDVLVDNIPELYRAFMEDGSRIVHGWSEVHVSQRERSVYSHGHKALLGWGAFIRKEWLEPLEQYVAQHGADYLFKREADRFFTLLLGGYHNSLPAQIRLLPRAEKRGIALYRAAAHKQMSALAVRRALAHNRVSKSVRFPIPWNVVVISHNYAHFLEEAVHSVLMNDADYILTIVDDASSDDTPEVARRFCQEFDHINYIRHDNNVGVSHARNSGIAAVESLYVVTLDADDKIGPDYLFEAERLLRSGWDVANPDAILFGNKSTRWKAPERTTLPMLLKRNCVHYAAAFRRSDWAIVQGIDETMDHWWDYDFWIRIAGSGANICRVSGDHFYYRKHGKSKSSESHLKKDELRSTIQAKNRRLFQSVSMR